MKTYAKDSEYPHKWEDVVVAHWRRYPNPFSRHVISEDTLCRIVSATRIYTRRLLTKTNRLPEWGKRFISVSAVPVVEESIVDLTTKVLTTYTRNLTYTRVMCVDERCDYKPDPSAPQERTLVDRKAWISSDLKGFSHLLQRFGYERFKMNVVQTEKGFMHTLARLAVPQQQSTLTSGQGKKTLDLTKIKPLPLNHS